MRPQDFKEFGDFSGGIIDDQDGRPDAFAKDMENFELLHNKKIRIRPGSSLLGELNILSRREIGEGEQIIGSFSLEETSMYFIVATTDSTTNSEGVRLYLAEVSNIEVGDSATLLGFKNGLTIQNILGEYKISDTQSGLFFPKGMYKGVFSEFGSNLFYVNRSLASGYKIAKVKSTTDRTLTAMSFLPNFDIAEGDEDQTGKLVLVTTQNEAGNSVSGNEIELSTSVTNITQSNLGDFPIGQLIEDDDAVLDIPGSSGTTKRVVTGRSSTIRTKQGSEGGALQEFILGEEKVRYGDIIIRSETASLMSYTSSGTTHPQENYLAESVEIHILQEDIDKFDVFLATSLTGDIMFDGGITNREIFPENLRDVEFTRQEELIEPQGTSRKLVVYRKSILRKQEGTATSRTIRKAIHSIAPVGNHWMLGSEGSYYASGQALAFNKSDLQRDASADINLPAIGAIGQGLSHPTPLRLVGHQGDLYVPFEVTGSDGLAYIYISRIRSNPAPGQFRFSTVGRIRSAMIDSFEIDARAMPTRNAGPNYRLFYFWENDGQSSNGRADTSFFDVDITNDIRTTDFSDAPIMRLSSLSTSGRGFFYDRFLYAQFTDPDKVLQDRGTATGRVFFFNDLEDRYNSSGRRAETRSSTVRTGTGDIRRLTRNRVSGVYGNEIDTGFVIQEQVLANLLGHPRSDVLYTHVTTDYNKIYVICVSQADPRAPAYIAYAFNYSDGSRDADSDISVTETVTTITDAGDFDETETQKIVRENTGDITANFRYGPDFDNLGPTTIIAPSKQAGRRIQPGEDSKNSYAFAFCIKREYNTTDNRTFVERTRVRRVLRDFDKPLERGVNEFKIGISLDNEFLIQPEGVEQLDVGNRQDAIDLYKTTVLPRFEIFRTADRRREMTITLEIYRTKLRGTEYFLIEEYPLFINSQGKGYYFEEPPIRNFDSTDTRYATRFFESTLNDDELDGRLGLYTNGGEVDNDPPPTNCKSLHILRGAAFYIKENRLYQSKPGQFDRVPDSFFLDFEEPLTSIFSADRHLIVTTANKVYLINGLFTSLGTGGLTAQEIYASDGCLGPTAYTKGEKIAYFLGSAGIYVTDGFKVERITDSLNETYKEFIANSESISCALDESKKKIYVSNEKRTWVLDYRFGHASYFWINNFLNRAPRDLLMYKDTLIEITDTFLYQKKDDYFRDDIQPNIGDDVPITDSSRQDTKIQSYPIIPYFESVRMNFGTGVLRKWINRVAVNVFSTGISYLNMFIKRDRKETKYTVTDFRIKPKFEWRDPLFKWRDPEFKWRPFSGFYPLSKRIDSSRVRINSIAIGLEAPRINIGVIKGVSIEGNSSNYFGRRFSGLIFEQDVTSLGILPGDILVKRGREKFGLELTVVYAGFDARTLFPTRGTEFDIKKTLVVVYDTALNNIDDIDIANQEYDVVRRQGSEGLEVQSLGINVTSTTHSDKEVNR